MSKYDTKKQEYVTESKEYDTAVTTNEDSVTNSNVKKCVLRYKPHKEQEKVHRSNARFKIICAGRRAGKTMLVAADMINRIMSGIHKYNSHSTLGWIAPTLQMSQRGVDAFKLITKDCPELIEWRKSAPITATFVNGVKVVFLSADNEDSLRGYGWDHLVIDEANYLPDYLWDAVIRPSLADKKGSLMAISTPRAKNTFFHNLYLQGLQEGNDYIQAFHFPTITNPIIDESEINEARKTLPEKIYIREFLAEFTDDGGDVFSGIENCVDDNHCNCKESDIILGTDLAKHSDFTVCLALCQKCGRIKSIERFNDLDWPTQKKLIKNVYIDNKNRSPQTTMVIDSTGIGDVIYDDLKSEGVNVFPFKFNNTSKQHIINNLRLMIMEGRVKWNRNLRNAEILKLELECYETQSTRTGLITYNARNGMNDDTVIALALAVSRLPKYISPKVETKEDKEEYNFLEHFEEIDNRYDWGEGNATFFG